MTSGARAYLWTPLSSLAGQTLAHGERVWYFTVSGFVLLSQLGAIGKLSIFIVRSWLISRAIYSEQLFCNGSMDPWRISALISSKPPTMNILGVADSAEPND